MRIVSVEIRNILGTRSCSFKPGTLTTISGQNGSGKSSILQAILQAFQGGKDSSLLRRGAKFGEIILGLDNGAHFKVRVTPTSTTYEATDNTGADIPGGPRTYIEQLGNALSVDPAQLLLAKPKDLAAQLLKIMPLTFGQQELQEAVGEKTWPIARDMALEEVDKLVTQIYETRATANKQQKEAEISAKQLRASLPSGDAPTDYAVRVKELRDLQAEAKQERESAIQAIERKERDACARIKADFDASIQRLREECQSAIDAVHIDTKAQVAHKDQEYGPDIERISQALGEAEEQLRNADRNEGIRRMLDEKEKLAADAKRNANSFSDALDGIEQLRQSKLSSLPIPGLMVRDWQTYLDGVPFERVNLAERVKTVLNIGSLLSGELHFMILDQAESFDSETWEAFKAGAVSSGWQIIAARVADGPLAIETLEEQPELTTA